MGTIGDNLGYYGFIFVRDIIQSRKPQKQNCQYNLKSFIKNIRNIVIEFGPAEIIDSLLIRPACMYFFPL